MNQLTTPQDVEDFLRGANFMSASGGGDPVNEQAQLIKDLEDGMTLGWQPIDEFDDDDLICTACFSGSIAPEAIERHGIEDAIAPGPRVDRPLVAAIQALEEELGRSIDGLISIEIGGINTGSILDAAAAMGKPLVDADYAGRAIPELSATTLNVFDVEVLPQALADDFGNEIIIRKGASNDFVERIGKYLAQSSFGLIGCAIAALPAKTVSDISVHGTISECVDLGRAIRLAREAGNDPVEASAQALEGWVLFRGSIKDREWSNTGYMEGFHTLDGEGDFAGHELKVWFKNENHVTWLDGNPYVASPDMIETCDAETAEPLVNTYLDVGDRVAIVGMPRRDVWNSQAGLDSLGPGHFGWPDFPFHPIEELVGATSRPA
jgi:hypothetical protein